MHMIVLTRRFPTIVGLRVAAPPPALVARCQCVAQLQPTKLLRRKRRHFLEISPIAIAISFGILGLILRQVCVIGSEHGPTASL